MLTRMKGLFRWLTGLLKTSPAEMQQAGVYLGRLCD